MARVRYWYGTILYQALAQGSKGQFDTTGPTEREKEGKVRRGWCQTLRGMDTSGAHCLPPRRSLQTNSGVAVLMNYLSFDVVSCGLVDTTVISLVSTAAVAAALHRTNACRSRVQPLPRARKPVCAVHSMCVT